MGLSFTIAAGPRQHSHSQVRARRDSWPSFTVSDWRLPQPGGPGPCIYIPQEQGGPVISPGTGLNALFFSARFLISVQACAYTWKLFVVTKTCLPKRWLLSNGGPTVDCVTSTMCLPICFRGYLITVPLPSKWTSAWMNVGGSLKGFLRVLRVPLTILIPPTAPCSLSILSLTLYGLDTDSLVKY
jgi:hypothetical protein